MPFDITTFWGNNYYQNPPLTDHAAEEAEAQLGVQLPESYLRLLRVQNGGYTQGFALPMSAPTSWAEDHIPLDELNGIVVDRGHQGVHNILLTEYMTREWGLPPNQVLLAGDGHWWLSLDYRKSSRPAVSWLDVEIGEDIVVAATFSAFVDRLVPSSRFS